MVLLKGSGGSSFAAKLDARDRAVYERCTPVQRYLWEEEVALRSSLAGEEADIFDELAPARRTAFLRPVPVEASGGREDLPLQLAATLQALSAAWQLHLDALTLREQREMLLAAEEGPYMDEFSALNGELDGRCVYGAA